MLPLVKSKLQILLLSSNLTKNPFTPLLSDVKQYQNLIKTLSYLLTSYNYKRKCNEMASQNDGNANVASFMILHGMVRTYLQLFWWFFCAFRGWWILGEANVCNELEAQNWKGWWIAVLQWLWKCRSWSKTFGVPRLLHPIYQVKFSSLC